MTKETLTAGETLAAKMFFDVAVQSSFALEDPNARFADVFKREITIEGVPAKSFDDVVPQVYEAEIEEDYIAFTVKPKNSHVWSRVLMSGVPRQTFITFLEDAMKGVDYFKMEAIGAVDWIKYSTSNPDNNGNLVYRLTIDPKLNSAHDVAVIFAWSDTSVKGELTELSAWPIGKDVDLKS